MWIQVPELQNAHSSRSHTIAMLTVEKKAVNPLDAKSSADKKKRTPNSQPGISEKVLVGKLFLVDLAGSERLKKSGSEGLRASEAMSVNMSLTALGKCISARADPSVLHVPFRDSKLTRLLQESLGGNAKTSLIVNIAPCSEYLQETLSSLQFGARAMKVATRAIINVEEEFRSITRNLQEALDLQDERVHSLEAAVHHKDAQLEAAKLSLELKTREMERLREEQKLRDEQAHRSEKFLEQLKVKDKDWQNRLELIKIAAKDHLIEKENDRMDDAARRIQKAYKKHYVMHILEEKRKVELVAGSMLLANSASKVLKSISTLDDYFTAKRGLC
ncbi:kinesin-like protein KIN-UA [Selaginella moellendorffii]|nr:kinesin-like protein KIN-UA [Selaginella moellendorffii]|eukprot:XP_024530375.1 kinesin-like protein KIN-UA [Selaginella moellendorffii]